MASLRRGITALLYPAGAVCVACGALRVDVGELCRPCAQALAPLAPPRCPRCGRPGWSVACPDCQIRPPDALDARFSAFAYEKTARALARALKYDHVLAAADILAMGMAPLIASGAADALVPVPLHKRRLRQRGFNQALALCRPLARQTGLEILDALVRLRSTRTQTRLTRHDREKNVRGAFAVRLPVAGLSLLLVDDVMTTGATALACAEVLKAAGAKRVALLTAVRAASHSDA